MNAAQIHLALNHAPLFLSLTGGLILITGILRKNESLKTVSLYMLVAAAIFTAPVFLTGEGTEEIAEHLPGVNEAAIERHEEMAKISLIIIAFAGAAALSGLFFRKNAGISKLILMTSFILSLASFGAMAQTAHLGGLIRHTELQNNSNITGNESGEDDKEDDD